MNFDLHPHTHDSIVQPNGDIVIPQDVRGPLAVGGITCVMSVIGIIQGIWEWNTFAEPLMIGGPFFILGIITFFIRYEARVDLRSRQVYRRWGLGKPEYVLTRKRSLDEFDGVTYGDFEIRSDKGSYTVYFVGLSDPATGRWLELTRVRDESDSRRYGETIAQALSLPLRRAGSSAAARSPHELNRRLVDQVELPDLPPTPPSLRTTIEREAGKLVLTIPGPDSDSPEMRRRRWIVAGVLVANVGMMLVGSLLIPGTNIWMQMIAISVSLPMTVAVYWMVIAPFFQRYTDQAANLVLDRETLTIWERNDEGQESTTEFRLDEIEEFSHDTKFSPAAMRASDSGASNSGTEAGETVLVASSDAASKSFAAWLPRDEKVYLAALVRQLIVQLHQASGDSAEVSEELEYA